MQSEKKELKKMNRTELIEIIYAMQQNNKTLQEENDNLHKQLDDKTIRIEKSGSIAEAALSLNLIFEKAEDAAKQYVESIKIAAETNSSNIKIGPAEDIDNMKTKNEAGFKTKQPPDKQEDHSEGIIESPTVSGDTKPANATENDTEKTKIEQMIREQESLLSQAKEKEEKAEKVLEDAKKECEEMREKTKQECASLLGKADQEAKKKVENADKKIKTLLEKYPELRTAIAKERAAAGQPNSTSALKDKNASSRTEEQSNE